MRKLRLVLPLFFAFTFLIVNDILTNVGGSPTGRSGGPGESTCTSCHSGQVNSGLGTLTVSSNAPNDVYTPGVTYTMTVTIEQGTNQRFGFLVLSGYSSGSNASEGSITITNSSETQQKTAGARRYVTHRQAGTAGANGTKSWTFDWTAPGSDIGAIEFYAAGNAANNNGQTSGDRIYTTSYTLNSPPVSIDDEQIASLTVYPTRVHDKVTVKVENLLGSDLNIRVLDASGSEIHSLSRSMVGSSKSEDLDATQWASGIYFVEVSGEGYREIQKVIKF